MKNFFNLILVALVIGLLSVAAEAEVVIPEGGRLAGSLNSLVSEFGDEFFNFPFFMVPQPPPGNTKMTGWLEVQFGEPQGNLVPFQVMYSGFGAAPEFIEFGGGQEYFVSRNQAFPSQPNVGILNLVTGKVESIFMDLIFRNSLVARTDKLNRFFFAFPHSYPPPDIGIPLPPLPPGFFFSDAKFSYDADGNIVGFQFVGQSVLPVGPAAALNDIFGLFPLFAFGPTGEIYWPNPENCKPGTPESACPSDETNPDGITLPDDALFHPHLILKSDDLEPVAPERSPLECAAGQTGGLAVTTRLGQLYVIGGIGAAGRLTDRVQIVDPSTGAVVEGPPLPTRVVDPQGGIIGSKIYVVGGRRHRRGPATSIVQILDLRTGQWTSGIPALAPLARGTAAVVGGRLYLLGGLTNRPSGSPAGNLRLANSLQVYDPITDTWTLLPAFAGGRRVFREAPSAVAVGADIYLLGGRDLGGEVTDEVLIFDTLNYRFRPGPRALWGTYEAVAGSAGGRVYLMGGRRRADGPTDSGMQILELDRGGLWIQGHDAPMPVAAGAGAVVQGQLISLGGRVQVGPDAAPGLISTAVQAFDPRRGWQICSTRPIFASVGVLNTASLSVGPPVLAPGTQASIVGYNFAPPTLGPLILAPPTPSLPTELGGIRVEVDSLPAPILAVTPNRIDFQVPQGVRGSGMVPVRVTNALLRATSAAVEVPMAPFSPGIFIQNCGVTHEPLFLDRSSAIACHADGTLNYFKNAVPLGERLWIQMTGLGPVEPPVADGQRVPAGPPVRAVTLPNITVLDSEGLPHEATVLSANLAAGEVGIFDVEIVVPAAARIGNRVEIQAEIGGLFSNRAMISVGGFNIEEPLACQRDTNPIFRNCIPPFLQTTGASAPLGVYPSPIQAPGGKRP